MTPKDKPDVIEFLTKFFFRDEPLNIETGITMDYINGNYILCEFFFKLKKKLLFFISFR